MKFRPQRGGLDESMADAREFTNSADFMTHVLTSFWGGVLKVEPYGHNGEPMPDDRIGWSDTWIVTIDDKAIGFTDGPMPA